MLTKILNNVMKVYYKLVKEGLFLLLSDSDLIILVSSNTHIRKGNKRISLSWYVRKFYFKRLESKDLAKKLCLYSECSRCSKVPHRIVV